ncbi:hypothetical protein DHEL01_v205783 [Diaporthe helianthi]|uniref:AMP-dependent synthetase/ligase domain-containing protein n=1 Tax=Diaporthe helianthi TaxID=158607 RepID=A0A2P5HZZ4_DIAHE|nr:hypothetical protein DHEL01_v205783 [Diaporthe helianthi]
MSADTIRHKPELFVRKIDEKAQWIPHETVIRFPRGPDWETCGYRSLTWSQYADSVNKTAHWLDKTLGRSVKNDTIAYAGPSDLRYAFIFAALNKTSRKLLVPDGRFMQDGLGSLLKATDCKVWLHAEGEAFKTEAGLGELGIETRQFPSLEWCLEAEGTTAYPYTKTYEEAKHDEIIIIHTSGTTGPPKPIVMNNGFWAAGASYATLARLNWPRGISTDSYFGRSLILACPMRWLAGVIMTNSFAVFYRTVVILPPPDLIALPPNVFEKILKMNYEVDGLMGFPHTIVNLYKDSRTRESLKSLEFITYLGAALDREVGDALCEHTRLGSVMGATESGGRFSLHPIDRKLWYTFQFIPEHHVRLERVKGSGVEAGGSDDDDVYHAFIDRPPGGGPSELQCGFWNFRMYGDVDSIDVKELWKPVKDLDGSTRWEFAGRADDYLKLIWACKFQARDMEVEVARYPGVKHVMVGGSGRSAPFVLIEVDDKLLQKNPDELLDDIYGSSVAAVNEKTAPEARIPRETVFLAKKEKPLRLTVKGLVSRRDAEKDYEQEIKLAYDRLANAQGSGAEANFITYMK